MLPDSRVDRFIRLAFQLAGFQDATRPNFEMRDRLTAELRRDFPNLSPLDDERAQVAIRRATNT